MILGGNDVIDNRRLKEFEHEIDDALQGISDTSILLNFQQAIVSLYPHVIPINAFAYDSWDGIVMPLFMRWFTILLLLNMALILIGMKRIPICFH